jgi:hypothetical protein
MSEFGAFQIDLMSVEKAEEEKLETIKSEILNLDFDKNLLMNISESIEIGKTGFWEIFLEADSVEILDDEEFSNLILSLESIIGLFGQGSNYSWTIDIPFSSKFWQKELTGWEVIFEEKNTYEENEDFDLWDDE